LDPIYKQPKKGKKNNKRQKQGVCSANAKNSIQRAWHKFNKQQDRLGKTTGKEHKVIAGIVKARNMLEGVESSCFKRNEEEDFEFSTAKKIGVIYNSIRDFTNSSIWNKKAVLAKDDADAMTEYALALDGMVSKSTPIRIHHPPP
jgi:hypothetical protein